MITQLAIVETHQDGAKNVLVKHNISCHDAVTLINIFVEQNDSLVTVTHEGTEYTFQRADAACKFISEELI